MRLLRALLLIPVAWADRLMDWIAPIRHLTPVDLVTPTDVPAAGAQAPQPPGGGHPIRATSALLSEAAERVALTAPIGSYWADGLYGELLDRAAQFAAHGD